MSQEPKEAPMKVILNGTGRPRQCGECLGWYGEANLCMCITPASLGQRQDSLREQLQDVVYEARRMGCYDAADWIRRRI